MSIMTVTTRITRRYLENKTKSDLAQMYLDLLDIKCNLENAVQSALTTAGDFGQIDGDHHKAWVIDQMVRTLTGPDYAKFVADHKNGEDGPETYDWNEGIAP